MKTMVLAWGIPPWITGSSIVVANLVEAMDPESFILVGERPEVGESMKNLNIYYLDSIGPKRKGNKYWRLFQLPRLIKQTTLIAKNTGCTQILCIFPDELYMQIGLSVARKLNLDFYPWFHNTYVENRTGFLKWLAKIWQKQYFAEAKKIFTISDGLTALYQQSYKEDKFITLNHGFPVPSVSPHSNFNQKGNLKFVFTGNLNHSCSDATVRIFNWIKNNELGEFHVFSGQNKNDFKQFGIEGNLVHFHAFMEFEPFVQNFQNFDILLLPHGLTGLRSKEEYQTIFPTRTIPYLYGQRPILAVSPEKAYLTQFLKENQCAHVSTNGTQMELDNLLDEILFDDNKREQTIKNALRIGAIFDVQNVLSKFNEITQQE